MKLWINPFLNTFYEWGLDKYWIDKLSFIKFLDHGNDKGEQVAEIEEYIKEKVPEWYWEHGFSWWIESIYHDEILKCWEEDEPFVKEGQNEFIANIIDTSMKGYEEYPEYLKGDDGMMLELYPHWGASSHPYAKLIQVGDEWFNSLYFTAVKGKSWCDISSEYNFINWVNRNPMEVKE